MRRAMWCVSAAVLLLVGCKTKQPEAGDNPGGNAEGGDAAADGCPGASARRIEACRHSSVCGTCSRCESRQFIEACNVERKGAGEVRSEVQHDPRRLHGHGEARVVTSCCGPLL